MTRLPVTHLSDEELAVVADGFTSQGEMKSNPHLALCEKCQEAVREALRGLTLLAMAADPPKDMESHVRARRWAAAHNPSMLATEDAFEDIAEVAGRGTDADDQDGEDAPPKADTPPEN
jgi:hypothetical protein